MRKGQTMPAKSRLKMSRTKQERVKREQVGRKAIQLLLSGKIKQAREWANLHAALFFSDKL